MAGMAVIQLAIMDIDPPKISTILAVYLPLSDEICFPIKNNSLFILSFFSSAICFVINAALINNVSPRNTKNIFHENAVIHREDECIFRSAEIIPTTTITHTAKNIVGRRRKKVSNRGTIFLCTGWY